MWVFGHNNCHCSVADVTGPRPEDVQRAVWQQIGTDPPMHVPHVPMALLHSESETFSLNNLKSLLDWLPEPAARLKSSKLYIGLCRDPRKKCEVKRK